MLSLPANRAVLRILRKTIEKIGFQKVLFMVGDAAVKATKTKEDDILWEKVKKILTK
jgi:hypothetical protein